MARNVTWGSPDPSAGYLFPRRRRLFWPSLLGAFLFLFFLLLVYIVGFKRTASPGPLIAAHATLEGSNCKACHTVVMGVSNGRCQRCHDPSTAGRLDVRTHVLFGSGDVKKAAGTSDMDCASCHVEHRGRSLALTKVDELNCYPCHKFDADKAAQKSLLPASWFKRHPEFKVLREKAREAPGLKFGHGSATASFKGHVKEVAEKKKLSTQQACFYCHEPQGTDFQPVNFDRHCFECHKGNLVPTVGVAEDDLAPEAVSEAKSALAAAEASGASGTFEVSRGKITKSVVVHRDPWILASLNRLRRELQPDAFAAERAGLQSQLSRLRRRLSRATPLVTASLEELDARKDAIQQEIDFIDKRLASLKKPEETDAGFSRVDESLGALQASAGAAPPAALQLLRADAEALKAGGSLSAGLSAQDFDARRREVLALLEAVESVDPELKGRADDLRRRLLALTAGDSSQDVLTRARDERLAEIRRIEDEVSVHDVPVASAELLKERRLIEKAIEEAEARLKALAGDAGGALDGDVRERKMAAVEALTGSCVKCHIVGDAKLARVRAARPVLVRAEFIHRPHLQRADCAKCHSTLEESKVSSDLNFLGVGSCQECHRSGEVADACLSCHRYHPPAVP